MRSSTSFSVNDGTLTFTPGMFIPFFSESMPPLIALHTTSVSLVDSTVNFILPSSTKIVSPLFTSLGSSR